MTNLVSTLTLQLKDDGLAAKAKADAEALKKLGASGADLKKLGAAGAELTKKLDGLAASGAKLDAFRSGSRNLKDLSTAMRTARADVAATSAAVLKADAKTTKSAQRAHTAALKREEAATAAFVEQGRAVRDLRKELLASGVGRAGRGLAIGQAMRQVQVETEAANAALHQHVRMIGNATQVATKHQRTVGPSMLGGMGGAGRAQLGRIEAGRRMIDGMGAPARAAAQAHADEVASREQTLASRKADRREAAGTIAAATSLYLGHKGKEIGLEAINSAARFDYGVRYQHIATDVSEEDQQKILVPQAKRIGQETKFSNEDVVHAQTGAMQGLPFKDAHLKAEVGAAIVDQARNYAVIMGSDMTRASEGIRAFLQNTNKDISTATKAVEAAQRGTNLVVKAAKLGGMNDEDAQDFMKFGLPTATQAGFTDVTSMALGALARRSGLRGSEAGVFVRAASSKLISPTREGREAEIMAGIDRSKYQKMPERLSEEAFEKIGKGRFGLRMSKGQRDRLGGMFRDGDLLQDEQEFTKRVSGVVAESFEKNKKGKLKAQDAQKIAKLASQFYRMSVQSTDVEGLLEAHMNSPTFTAALRNKFYTDKHGGKAGMIADHFDQLKEDREELRHVSQTPTFSSDRSKYMTKGLGGSIDNVKGAYETTVLNLGTKNAGMIQGTADAIAAFGDAISGMPDKTVQAGTAMAMIGATGTSAASALAIWGRFTGSTALTGLAGMGATAMLPVLATAALGGVIYAASDENKGIVHGGKNIDTRLDASDELPGLGGMDADVKRPNVRGIPSMLGGGAQRGAMPGVGTAGSSFGLGGAQAGNSSAVPAGPIFDTAKVDDFTAKLGEAGAKAQQLGSTQATPQIGTGPVDNLIARVTQAISLVAQLGAAVADADAGIARVNAGAGRLQGRSSASFSDGVTPGRGAP